MKDVKGSLAVITGGASGIGYGLASAFGKAGARPMLLDIEAKALDAAVAKLVATGIDAAGAVVDVTDRQAMRQVAGEIEAAHGPIHMLCNNAGVGTADPLQIARGDDWDWVLSVNLMGVINGLLAFLPAMTRHGEPGHIVNTASVAGLFPMRDIGIYNTSKFAVIGLTETLRDDLAGTTIGVSALCPGYVNTNINQSRRNRQAAFGASRPPQISADAMRAIDRALKTRGLAPEAVGEMVLDGMRRDLFYIVTDPTFWLPVRRRFERMAHDIAALHGGLPASE